MNKTVLRSRGFGWLRLLNVQIIRYALVGVGNTAIGYGVVFFLQASGFGVVSANATGYAFGLMFSFFVNRCWSFESKVSLQQSLPRFLMITALAYLANISTVLLFIYSIGVDPYLGQLTGAIPYFLIGYFGAKFFAFAEPPTALSNSSELSNP